MSRSLVLTFNSAVAKYSQLNKKVRKSISKGEFWRFTRRKRQHLLHKIERLKRRIIELRFHLKFAGAGLAAGLVMMTTGEVAAQNASPLGPFVENKNANPFPKPAFDRYRNPVITFFDLEKDGDLDAVIMQGDYPSSQYYQNTGTNKNPQFSSYWQSGIDLLRDNASGTGSSGGGRIAFADIDDDGDLDAVVGMDNSDDDLNSDIQNDIVFFYRNDALSPSDAPIFNRDYGSEHPFASMTIKKEGWPAFSDIDGDGDLDFILAGEFDDKNTGKTAWVQVFKNQKEGHEPGINATYQPLQTNDNPLYIGESSITASAGFFDISFADLDGDGDEDFFWTDQHGQIRYKRNDKGTFVDQEGKYVYKPGGTSTGNPMEINNLFLSTPNNYKSLSFGDLDGDGDTDLVIGTNNVGDLNSPYIYVENTGNGVMVADRSYSNFISGFYMGYQTTATFTDYDKDGDEDFLTTGTVVVPKGSEGLTEEVVGHAFFKNNNGKFELQQTPLTDPFAVLAVKGNKGRWITADMDGDIDIDAIFLDSEFDPVLQYDVATIQYYRNDGNTFTLIDGPVSPFKPILDLKYYYPRISFGDLNSDGLPDVVMIGNGNTPIFFKNTGVLGSPVFEQDNSWKDGLSTESGELTPKLVDLDSDGDNDMVLGKYWYVWYYENVGNGTTPAWKEYHERYEQEGQLFNVENPFGTISNGGGIVPDVVDVDGDGDKDLFFANYNRGFFSFYENQNPAPNVLHTGPTQFALVANKAITLDPTFTVVDPDNDKIVQINVKVEPYEQGKELLHVNGLPGTLTESWNAITGVLTISGSAPIADYQAALKNIQYVYTGVPAGGRASNGRTIQKTITVTTLDSDLTVVPSNTAVFQIGHSNTKPVISPGSFLATFNSTSVPVIPGIVLTDGDDTTMGSAEVKIDAATYIAAQDRLTATFAGTLSGSFNTTTGVLQINGTGTVAEYQQTLRSVAYSNLLGAGATKAPRTLSVKVNDGESDSNIGVVQVSVGSANTPPTISGTATPFYVSGELVINNNIVVTDPDTLILGANVVFATGFINSEDVLLFTDQNGITGTYNSTAGLLTLSGPANPALYQAALRSVKYKNTAATPNTGDRAVVFSVTDGGPQASVNTVITINKPPVVEVAKKNAATDGNVAFGIPEAITDPDNNLDLSTLQVTSEKGVATISGGIVTVDYSASKINDPVVFDNVTISVCDTGGRCTTYVLIVELRDDAFVYSGMSPNGDGVNDWFTIDFLPEKTQVAIFNRWGEMVFETNDYDVNEPANRFEGKNKNGTEVVAGAYFYKIRYPDGRVRTGSIILNR
jgi:gliding motility-associated-like protein